MCRALCLIGTVIGFTISVIQADVNIKEIGQLMDITSKTEGILLISLESVVNGIKKTVNEEIYESEKISEEAGKCAVGIGEQAIKMTGTVMSSYVRYMFNKIEKLNSVLTNHTATTHDLEAAKSTTEALEAEILLDLLILQDEVLLPEARQLSRKMDHCKELR